MLAINSLYREAELEEEEVVVETTGRVMAQERFVFTPSMCTTIAFIWVFMLH